MKMTNYDKLHHRIQRIVKKGTIKLFSHAYDNINPEKQDSTSKQRELVISLLKCQRFDDDPYIKSKTKVVRFHTGQHLKQVANQAVYYYCTNH